MSSPVSSRSISITLGCEPAARLDKAIHAALPSDVDISRSRLTDLIKSGALTITNGGPITNPSSRPVADGTYTLTLPAAIPMELVPEAIALDIAYEDDDLIVVNKPAGMVVHPAPGARTGTLVAALLHHCGDSLSGIGDVLRPGIVHRIDKDTSGLLVVAKSQGAHHGLAAQFADHSIKRRYAALVWGVPDKASPRLMGIKGVSPSPGGIRIEAPIARAPRDRKKMAVVKAKGKNAITHVKITERFKGAARVTCQLETGRTHQIRVHMTHIGHPLIGDPVYGRQRKFAGSQLDKDALAQIYGFSRQALHAQMLGFVHPVSGKEIVFEAPLPPDFEAVLAALRVISG